MLALLETRREGQPPEPGGVPGPLAGVGTGHQSHQEVPLGAGAPHSGEDRGQPG